MKRKERNKSNSNRSTGDFIVLAGIIIITFIAFYFTLNNGFLTNWDDHEYVLNNTDIKDFSWQGIKKMFTSFYIANYHPLTMLSYAIDYKLFGLSSKAFHAVNLCIHLSSTIVVFYLMRLLVKSVSTSVIVTVCFAIHPVHVESVAWIAERKDVLYGFYFLLSLFCYVYYIQKTNKKFLFFSFLFFILSCLSKSAAVVLPMILLLVDYYLERQKNLKLFLEKIHFFTVSLIFGIVALISQKAGGATTMAPDYSLFERFFIVCYSVAFYIVKMFFPFHLSAMYYYPSRVDGLLPANYYLSPIIVLGIVFALYKAVKFRKELVFGILFFLITVALVIQIIPVGRTVTADRYAYIPYIGLAFIVGRFYDYLMDKKITFSYLKPKIVTYILLGYAVIFFFSTWNRIKVWQSPITLFDNVIENYPKQSHGYLARASAKMDLKDYQSAMVDYDKGIELDTAFAEAYNNRGNVSYNLNNFEEAIRYYTKAIEKDNDYPLPYNNRGSAKRNLQDYEGALQDYSKAVEYDPKFFVAWNNRGLVHYQLKNYKEAILDYDKTLEFRPDYTEAYSNRGVAKYYLQDYKGALEDYNKAIEQNPNYGEAYSNRGAVKYYFKEFKSACDDWTRAAQLNHPTGQQMLQTYCK